MTLDIAATPVLARVLFMLMELLQEMNIEAALHELPIPVRRLLGDERAGADGCAKIRVHLHVRSRKHPPSCAKCVARCMGVATGRMRGTCPPGSKFLGRCPPPETRFLKTFFNVC